MDILSGPRAGKRILLISTNKEDQPYPVYPIALDYLRKPLEAAGWETQVWDALVEEDAELNRVLENFNPDVVLISIRQVDNNDSVNTKNYLPGILNRIQEIRNWCQAKIILGGSGYSLFPEQILSQSSADAGVNGAGEYVVAKLASHLCDGLPIDQLPGVAFRSGHRVHVNPPTPAPMLQAPRWKDASQVRAYWKLGGIQGIQLKRGCPLSCVYCTYPGLEGSQVRRRTASSLVDEVAWLVDNGGVNKFFIVDSVANLDPRTLNAFAEELLNRDLHIEWSGYFSPKGMDPRHLELWRAAGLTSVELGIDTLSLRLLKQWRKGFKIEEARSAARACAALDIPYCAYLIFGGPGEDEDTVRETVDEISQWEKAVVFAFLGMRVYPGTPLVQGLLSEGLLTPETNLMEPYFYISSHLDHDWLLERASALGQRRNWLVVGRSLETKERVSRMLRARGAKGSSWELLAKL